MSNYCRVADIAKTYTVSTYTVRRWVKEGIIPAYQAQPGKGNVLLFDENEVESILRSRGYEPKNGTNCEALKRALDE